MTGEQFEGDECEVILMAIRQGANAAGARARGDDDAAAMHTKKADVLLDVAIYDLAN